MSIKLSQKSDWNSCNIDVKWSGGNCYETIEVQVTVFDLKRTALASSFAGTNPLASTTTQAFSLRSRSETSNQLLELRPQITPHATQLKTFLIIIRIE
jgi:hypothetical protein